MTHKLAKWDAVSGLVGCICLNSGPDFVVNSDTCGV